MSKIPVVIQMQQGENGAAALCMMLGYYKKYVPIRELREICVFSSNGSSPGQIADAAAHYGLNASVEKMDIQALRSQQLPLMIQWKRRYYAIIKAIRGDIVTVVDPAWGEYKISMKKLEALYTGTAILFSKTNAVVPGGRRTTLYTLIKGRASYLAATMAVLLLFTLICLILNLGLVDVEMLFLDEYVGSSDPALPRQARMLLLFYMMLLGIYTLFSIAKTYIQNKTSRQISADSGSNLLKKIFGQPMRFFEQYSPWEMISRLENNIRLDDSILRSLVPRSIDLFMSVIYFIILFTYNPVIAAVCVTVVAVTILISKGLQAKNAIAANSVVTSTNTVNSSILNGMNMIETILSLGGEQDFYNMWRRSQEAYNKNRLTQFKFRAQSNLVTGISRYVLQGAQLFMGAYFIVHGNFTLGQMALFQGYLSRMITSVNNCISSVNDLEVMRTNIERINDINERESLPTIPLGDGDPDDCKMLDGSICAKDLCFKYNPGDSPAVDHVSIEVKPGQMVAIVGSTGCGKSTLLKLLAGLYKAESGEILYSGKPRNEIPDAVFYSSIAMVDQDIVMFKDSVYNNITMWDSTVENYEVVMAAKDAQIHDRIMEDRKKYGLIIEENGRNFSGGELQRIELARALAHESSLLFLDEFTSALDAQTEDRAMNSLKAKNTTCVIVAHRLSTIVNCDRIYVMDHGRIVQEGTHEELYKQDGLYRTLIG